MTNPLGKSDDDPRFIAARSKSETRKHFHKLKHVMAREKIELCKLRNREEASYVNKCFVHFFALTN